MGNTAGKSVASVGQLISVGFFVKPSEDRYLLLDKESR
jgi:hypothetical protein